MRLIKIGIANVSTTVGAVRENAERVVALARELDTAGTTLGVFPEQVLGGYPAEDLVQWRGFVAAQWKALRRVADATRNSSCVFVLGLIVDVEGRLFNVAAVVHRGRVVGLVPKEKLPTYGVFYERRTLSAGAAGLVGMVDGVPFGDQIFQFDALTLAVEVCEDIWSAEGPIGRRCYSGAEVVVNISASPFRIGVLDTRREMLATRSADHQATVVYGNMVGAQDGLVFDGGGFVFQNGRLMLEAPRFREGATETVVDLDRTRRLRIENTTWRGDCEAFLRSRLRVPAVGVETPTADRSGLRYPAPTPENLFLPPATGERRDPRACVLDDLFEALALGTKDYFMKSRAFERIGIALSGGRDSVLTLLVAWRAVRLANPGLEGEALRREMGRRLWAFFMPTESSGSDTRAAAERICADLGASLREVPLGDAVARELDATRAMLDGEPPTSITAQNAQARLRGARMWNWANSARALFLQTSDMSERAVGYVTIGGDLEGALAVIANVPKTVVVALLERLHARFGFEGIALTLGTVPGPELAPQQAAEAELMPFAVLDACVSLHAGEKLAAGELAEALTGLFPDQPADALAAHARRFVDLFSHSIFKWVQAPITLHVGTLDLERERALQLPVIERNEWEG